MHICIQALSLKPNAYAFRYIDLLLFAYYICVFTNAPMYLCMNIFNPYSISIKYEMYRK